MCCVYKLRIPTGLKTFTGHLIKANYPRHFVLMMYEAYAKLMEINEDLGCLQPGLFDFTSSCQKTHFNMSLTFQLMFCQLMLALRLIIFFLWKLLNCFIICV